MNEVAGHQLLIGEGENALHVGLRGLSGLIDPGHPSWFGRKTCRTKHVGNRKHLFLHEFIPKNKNAHSLNGFPSSGKFLIGKF